MADISKLIFFSSNEINIKSRTVLSVFSHRTLRITSSTGININIGHKRKRLTSPWYKGGGGGG